MIRWFQCIKNAHVPACKDCTFFIPAGETYWPRCKRFGTRHLVTGDVEYAYADLCRQHPFKCGTPGRFFAPREPPAA